jgi:membrane protease YdiL (CAAX protease family)
MSFKPFAVVAELDPAIRFRAGFEVLMLVTATFVFIHYMKASTITLQLSLALPFVAFIVAGAKVTQTRIWGDHGLSHDVRFRRSVNTLTLFTLPAALACFSWAVWQQHTLANPNMIYAFVLYIPWALAQQFIFQFYFLGRLRAVMPTAAPIVVAMLNGLAYGLVHLPDGWLVLGTSAAGTLWSYCYLRDRRLLPIAVSHALLGVTFYYWVFGVDLFDAVTRQFTLH